MEYTRETLIKRLGEYVGILPSELHEIACEAVELLERFDCSRGNCGDLNSEWIPCSERMPNERGWYLITVQGMNRFSDMDYYYGNSEWDDVSSKQKVIAWMPLPKPYREDGE